MRRINVVGTSASGKSTFSKKIAEKLNLSYIELDDLFWLDHWQESSDQDFFSKLQNKIDQSINDTTKQGYVIDGNYSRTAHIKWKDVDTVIWLDIPFHLNLMQSTKRALSRIIFRKKLWENSNNKENIRQLFSRDSIIWWMIKTHKKNREKYLSTMNDPQYSHIQFIHLKSHREAKKLLNQLK